MMQVTSQAPIDEHTLQCVVFGSWLPDEELEEGLECCLVSDELMNGAATLTDANDSDVVVTKEPSTEKHHKKHLLKTLRGLLHLRRNKGAFDKDKHGDEAKDDASVATTAASSLCSSLGDDDDGVPLMQARLFDSGIVNSTDDFSFVVDKVSKEVVDNFTDEEKNVDDSNVAHVKTGVWQVTCLDDDGSPQTPFYIVTGVRMEDKVDTKKLRKAIFAGKTFSRRPKLSLALTEIAEELAGFQSGTMAPICHSVDMKLFLEESIITNVDMTTHKLNVGSGMFGKCLSISTEKFLQIAKMNPKGIEVCSIIKKPKASKQQVEK